MFYISLGIILCFLGASLAFRERLFWLKFARRGFYLSFLLVFLFLFLLSFIQLYNWSHNDFSKYLIPPYQPINYFIFYALGRIFSPYLFSAVAALLFLYLGKYLNKKYKEKIFEPEEIYLGALGIFLTAYPGFLFYIGFLIIVYLLAHFYSLFSTRELSRRISLYDLWLPTAVFAIIIDNYWIISLPIWQILKV